MTFACEWVAMTVYGMIFSPSHSLLWQLAGWVFIRILAEGFPTRKIRNHRYLPFKRSVCGERIETMTVYGMQTDLAGILLASIRLIYG